jgi:hypothetical protein
MNSLGNWIQSIGASKYILGYAWTWPAMETLHFIGLCLLMGAVLIMDLRLVGFQRMIPLSAVHALMPVAIAGFIINLVTGLGFLLGDPHLYLINPAFLIKMVLVLLAGLNFLLYYFMVEPSLVHLGPHDTTPALAKTVGFLSLVFWFGVLSYGRLLPYLGTGGG